MYTCQDIWKLQIESVLHDIFQNILLIFKWVRFQNINIWCSNIAVFYSCCTCLYGFDTVLLIRIHRELDLCISNDCLKWNHLQTNWFLWIFVLRIDSTNTYLVILLSSVLLLISFFLWYFCLSGSVSACPIFLKKCLLGIEKWNNLYLRSWKKIWQNFIN